MFRNERQHMRALYEQQPALRGDVNRLSDEVATLQKAEDESRAAIQLAAATASVPAQKQVRPLLTIGSRMEPLDRHPGSQEHAARSTPPR